MYVAMKDLEIRGAGNLLGGEQSGHIEGVGFDLYVRMVGEAVQQFKGEAPEEIVDVKVDLPIDAHLPHEYVGVERLRLEMYRKVADAKTAERLDEVEAEMRDRYGAAARAGAQPVRGGPVPAAGPPARASPTCRCRAGTSGSARCRCPTRSSCGSSGTTRTRSTRRRRPGLGAPPDDEAGRWRREPLRDTALLTWCEELLTTVLGS